MARDTLSQSVRPAMLVLGCGDIGSAIALALHRAGFAVVLIDDADPAWARRGMAFTNAWYLGSAELGGEAAVFCANAKSIPSVVHQGAAIAATTWSWPAVADLLAPLALVDARLRRTGPNLALIARAPKALRTVGVGPGFVVGEHVHIAVESAWGERLGTVVRSGSTAAHGGQPQLLGGAGSERFVHANAKGRFATSRRIGEVVGAGDSVGTIGREPVIAPLCGVLRGLSARGARVEAWNKVVEVDPRGDPVLCFGVRERAARIAHGVIDALAALEIADAARTTVPTDDAPRATSPPRRPDP